MFLFSKEGHVELIKMWQYINRGSQVSTARCDINILLLQREAFWIFILDTLFPRRLNEDFDIRPFR